MENEKLIADLFKKFLLRKGQDLPVHYYCDPIEFFEVGFLAGTLIDNAPMDWNKIRKELEDLLNKNSKRIEEGK